MKLNILTYTLVFFYLLGIDVVGKESPSTYYPRPSLGAFQEFGAIQNGVLNGNAFEDLWLDKFGVYFVQKVIVENKLHLEGGFGGVFLFPRDPKEDEFSSSRWPNFNTKTFYMGPSIARATYHFGEVSSPWMKLSVGMFGYKYNSEAYNLGEYLFRSEAYPGVLMNGGFTTIGSSTPTIQGVQASFGNDNWNLDVLATTETTLPPLYDVSLGMVGEYRLANGAVTLGGGVLLKRLISVKNEVTTSESEYNSYYTIDGKEYTGYLDYYKGPVKYWKEELKVSTTANDSTSIQSNIDYYQSELDVVDNVSFQLSEIRKLNKNIDSEVDASVRAGLIAERDSINALVPNLKQYSSSAVILMGRATVAFGQLLGTEEIFHKDALKLYAEAAVLGVKDYPVLYDNVSERIPIMVGVNVPTFKLLDLLAIQVEYFDSPHLNSYQRRGQSSAVDENINVPYYPTVKREFVNYSDKDYLDATKDDNLSWTILAKKNITHGIQAQFQMGKDHMRTVQSGYFFGPTLSPGQLAVKNSDWYWMFQLSWGI